MEQSQLAPHRRENLTKGLKEELPPKDNKATKDPKGPKGPKGPKMAHPRSAPPIIHGGRRRKTRSKRKGTRRH